ncbi:MAG: RNA 2',3'-cyclic phosphodiesterase [Planctomycetaceae bacterium]|nr:RNA 2',3'-cyclic phosphodiesterase [Planctomycetaceae bacterium]
MSKTRTFIAVAAVDAVHAAAVGAIERLAGATENVKWVEPENLHWTLQFLGDLDDQEMATVCMRVRRVAARVPAFTMQADGVGAFPSIQRPRTLWLGAGDGGEEFCRLQREIEDALLDLGFRADNRKFVPHLTLGRASRGGNPGPLLSERLAKLANYPAGDGGPVAQAVDEVTVFASELTREGPHYHVLATAPLGD